jgi:cytochrome c peroxidase
MKILLVLLSFLYLNPAYSLDLDARLKIIQELYELSPKNCSDIRTPNATDEEVRLGELLFTSTLLSGNNNIACINCHLDEFHVTDGLPLAVGVGGKGKGEERMYEGIGTIVPRNAISLVGTGNNKFTQFFWDGKVGSDKNGNIYSQLGMDLSHKFDNVLAVASIMPILERDELIGSSSIFNPNDIRDAVNNQLYQEKFKAVSEVITKRFENLNKSNDELKDLLDTLNINKVDLLIAGNFLSKFIANNFKCTPSKFDSYLSGNLDSLSNSEKQGAITFYGKGRCSSCHKGSFFSDNSFHSIGVYQGGFGPHSRHRDIGRAGVTYRVEDKYKFRTPTLIDISKTQPYGHNGSFLTLEDVVIQHFNPVVALIKNNNIDKFSSISPTLDSRDSVLSTIRINKEEELQDLLRFLKTL